MVKVLRDWLHRYFSDEQAVVLLVLGFAVVLTRHARAGARRVAGVHPVHGRPHGVFAGADAAALAVVEHAVQ